MVCFSSSLSSMPDSINLPEKKLKQKNFDRAALTPSSRQRLAQVLQGRLSHGVFTVRSDAMATTRLHRMETFFQPSNIPPASLPLCGSGAGKL